MTLIDRAERIRELCEGQRVLDVGCCAHGEFEGRNESGFLHQDVRSVAKQVVGLDNDAQAVEEAVKAGYNVVCGDAEALGKAGLGQFDVIVAGEIIEHLSNPGLFLDGALELLIPSGILIVTVPNAWSFTRLKQLRKGIDDAKWTHDQHTCWYSKSTITALLGRHGFCIDEVGFCNAFVSKQILKRVRDRLLLGWAMRPEFAESVFVVGRKK